VTENTAEMARLLEVEVEPQDAAELMESHSQPNSNEGIPALEQQRQENALEKAFITETKGLNFQNSLFKSFVMLKSAWLFWKSMIQILKEVQKSMLTLKGIMPVIQKFAEKRLSRSLTTSDSLLTYFLLTELSPS
jgi:hypothetical protein